MATIKKLDKDETFSAAVKVEGKKATVSFTASPSEKAKENGLRFGVSNVTLDFSNCTPAEIIEQACRPMVIDLQRRFRVGYAADAKKALEPRTWTQFDVKTDIIDAARAPQDPKSRIMSGWAKLTAPERAAILKTLQGAGKEEKAA